MKQLPLELTLHQKQGEAFSTTAQEILYGGAAYGGKSHLIRVAFISWCVAVPGLMCYLFRRNSNDIAKNHLDGPGGFYALLGDWIKAGLVTIVASPSVQIRFNFNGSKIYLNHCNLEKDKYHYQGAEIHVLGMDELTQFTDSMYRYLRGRVRLGGLKIPAQYEGMFPKIVSGSNPGGVGHNWVKHTFIDPHPAGEIWRAAKNEGGMLRQFISAKLEDNPIVAGDREDYESRLEGLGDPALVRAMRHGDWDIVSGGMFDDIWLQVKGKAVLHPFKIPVSWKVTRSFDWGSAKPFSVGWWAESDGTNLEGQPAYPRGTLFRIAEWYGWNGRPDEGCKMLAVNVAKGILELEQKMKLADRVKPGPADTSIWTQDNGPSIADDMLKAGVKWTKANKEPGSRRQGAEQLRKRLQAVGSVEAPGIYIFNTCRHWLRTVPTLSRSERDPEDVDTTAEDHAYDETRYMLTSVIHKGGTAKVAGVYARN